MKIKIQALYSSLISFLLVALGFNSCHNDPVDEYGTPSAKYKVRGKVVSKENTAEAIKDIRVVMIENVNESDIRHMEGDTVYTNQEGVFEINSTRFLQNDFKVKIADVDGDKNGSFKDRELVIEFEKSDYIGGNGWYEGEASKDLGKVELEPKQGE